MKRAVFVLIFLTLVVTLLPLYSRWEESQRQRQIHQVKQQARPIFGKPLQMVLTELKQGTPPSVVIVYTGGTKSHLEPCGCYQEQSGGLPRRAHLVEQLRQHGFSMFLVDAGDIFDGTEAIDAQGRSM